MGEGEERKGEMTKGTRGDEKRDTLYIFNSLPIQLIPVSVLQVVVAQQLFLKHLQNAQNMVLGKAFELL